VVKVSQKYDILSESTIKDIVSPIRYPKYKAINSVRIGATPIFGKSGEDSNTDDGS